MPEPARAGRGAGSGGANQRLEGGGSGQGADERNGKHPWADYRDLVAFACIWRIDRHPLKSEGPERLRAPSPAHRKMDVLFGGGSSAARPIRDVVSCYPEAI